MGGECVVSIGGLHIWNHCVFVLRKISFVSFLISRGRKLGIQTDWILWHEEFSMNRICLS